MLYKLSHFIVPNRKRGNYMGCVPMKNIWKLNKQRQKIVQNFEHESTLLNLGTVV